MKKKMLIGALVVAFVLAAACGKEAQPAQKSALEVIKARTSIRSFTGEKLSEEQINTLLDAAMAAPTAANEQPWRFIVITDDEVKAGLYSGEVHKKMVANAGAVIIVCGENTRLRRSHGADPDAQPVPESNPYWYEDCSAATENLLLAATALDLGAVWLSCYPIERSVNRIREYLSIPETVTPLAIVPVGYPAETPAPKNKWKPENIHYDKW
ncbi:MAG: nitroreductase family protein [Bacteroidales bacterium]|nr:nitroreductase family protein [Bacteroidales bacterium]